MNFKETIKPLFTIYQQEIMLFVIAVLYIFFFTTSVPLFWEEQIYQGDYVQQTTLHWVKEIFFSFGENNIIHALRPFDGLLFKILFSITGYNYIAMRFFKALLFGVFIVLIFVFVKKYMKNSIAAFCTSFFIMCSLSLYIHTLVFAEPYLLTETLKLIIFFIFFKDYFSEKTSCLRQFLIALLFLLSVRAYVPAYSTMGILGLFTLLYDRKKIPRYALLFLFFFITAIPWPLSTDIGDSSSAFAPKITSIQHFFLNDIGHYVLNPNISLQNLYYKPFFALLSFFGIWLIIICFSLFVLRSLLIAKFPTYFIIHDENENILHTVNNKMLVLFLFIWILAEFPLWIILPEHATRYGTSILLPFSLLVTLMILHVFAIIKPVYRKYAALCVIICIILICATNLVYVFGFRAGWGSSFIAIEKVQDFIAEDKEGKTIVLNYGQSVANEYYPINKSNERHEFAYGLGFLQLGDPALFSEENIRLITKNYTTAYVLKRVTSGNNELPPVAFDTYPSLEQIQLIEGTNTYDPFDVLVKLLRKNGLINYKPNYVHIYKVHSS